MIRVLNRLSRNRSLLLGAIVFLSSCASLPSSAPPVVTNPGGSGSPSPEGGLALDCSGELNFLADAMVEFRSNLEGIALDDYRQGVEGVREVFDGVDFDEFDYPCIEAIAAPLAASLAKYQEALSRWEACANDASCSAKVPSSAVTDIFVDASARLDEALVGLARDDQ